MSKRGIMQIPELGIDAIIAIISSVVTLLISKLIEWRKLRIEERDAESKRLLSDEQIDAERFRDTVTASQKLSEILITVVDPLSKRISVLENDSMAKQKQILELSANVTQLTRTIQDKDSEIIALNKKYQERVEISEQQEKKIQAQALRIGELEDELNRLKKRKE